MERLPARLLPGTNQRVGRAPGAGLRGALTGRSPAVAPAGGGLGARPSAAAPQGRPVGKGLPRQVPARSPRRGARRRRLRSAPPQVAAHEAGPLRTPALSARPARLRCPGGGRGLAAGPGRSRSVALPLCRSGGHQPREVSSNLRGPKQTGSGASLSASLRVSSAPRAARGVPRSPLPCAQPPP